MKHFNRHHFAILPLLSILSMSPGVMESKYADRHIASVVEEVKGHPKYEALVSKVDPKSLLKDRSLDLAKLKVKIEAFSSSLSKEREEFKKDQSDKVVVEEQRKKVELLVIDLLLVENGSKELDEKKALLPEEKEVVSKLILEKKDIIEGLLTDLESNEALVAKASEPKVEDKPVIVEEEPKKEDKPVVVVEEPKKEEPKKEEEKPVVVVEEPKKEEDKKEVVCEADEKNKALTAQVEQLLQQQNQIMQTMLGMAQMMVSMNQQQHQQPNPYYSNGPGFNVQNPYQYNQPFTSGNWVYMPNGFQPNQPNIFAQPMMQPQMQQQGIYPDQMHQQQQMQSNWNLQPDPRFQYQPSIPSGNFGNNGLSFNMSNMVPTISQG